MGMHNRLWQWFGGMGIVGQEGGGKSVESVDFGSLRRTSPVSRVFGFDRGRCIDRYYIENFLDAHHADIKGRVLEAADNAYTTKFGGEAVTCSDVLHVQEGAKYATVCADLTCAEDVIADNTYDCIILTQTLHVIFDLIAAVRNIHRILKPGGVLLASLPGISQVSRYDMDRWGDMWRFTDLSARKLMETVFCPEKVSVDIHGNVLTSVAFLHGLAEHELTKDELDEVDVDYQLLLTVRAQKEGGAA